MKKIFVSFKFFTLLIVLSSCSNGNTDSEKQLYNDTISVAVTPTIDCLPLFVAKETGLADSLKCMMQLQGHYSKADCDTALVGGSVSAIMTDYGRADFLKRIWTQRITAKQKGKKTVKNAKDKPENIQVDSLSILPHDNLHLYLFANYKARINEAKQLLDKMVAVDRKSAEAEMAQYVLDSVKLNNNKAFLVEVRSLKIRQQMLHNNTMDAVVLSEPQATVARKAGHKSLFSSGHHKSKSFGCLVARRKGEMVKAIYNRACDSINKNGIHHYDSIIVKHCGISPSLVTAMPNHKFNKIK